MQASVKRLVLDTVARTHLAYFQKHLPDSLAIYFHELDPWQVPKMDEALSYFADQGYRTVHPEEYAMRRVGGGKRLFVSFDDNFRGWHQAIPLFAKHGTRCTFYVNTAPIRDISTRGEIDRYFAGLGYTGNDVTMSRAEIRELHEAGHNIGCHTHSHPMASKMPRELWDEEIIGCRNYLEDLIGARVEDFSIPYGMRRHFSSALRQYCFDVGFKTITTAISGLQHRAVIDPLRINRTGWKFELSLEENLARLRVRSPFYAMAFGRCAVANAGVMVLPPII